MKKRKKKEPTKLVRIDHKTEIEVSIDIPDDVARENYFQKLEEYKHIERVRRHKTDKGPVGKANSTIEDDK